MITARKDTRGKVMALDLGEKRIGVALSDTTRTIASPYSVINRKSRAEDIERYRRLISEQEVGLLVIGLPIPLSGVEGQRAAWVRDYGEECARHLPVAVEYWDESLTTKEAEASLREQGRRGKKIKDRVDAVAAALILQAYLDAQWGRIADGE
jgi:putative holliday junction resolvase